MPKLRLLKLDHNRCPTYCYINESFTWVDLDHPALDEDCKQHVSGELKFLSHELRILIWHGCPLKSLPANFHPKNLVYLDMSHCHLEQLWEGTKPLKNLEYINLSYSQYLRELPDLTEATNLKKVILEGCVSLPEVHPSFSALENLVFWSLKACRELKILSSSSNMKSLQILNLSGCSNLERSPDTSEVMKELSELYLDGTAIKELPPSINNLPGLVTLSLKGCIELKILPRSIHMKSLKHLCLSGCSNLHNFPKISGVMKELSELYLDGTAIKELPSSIERLPMLAKLSMRHCKSLVFLPENICKLTCLEELCLEGCKRLKSIPELSSSINYIDAHDCTDLETVSTPMHLYNSRPCFIFSNCHKLEIPYAETRSHDHDHDHDQVDQPSMWGIFSNCADTTEMVRQ